MSARRDQHGRLRKDLALEHVICAITELGVPPKTGKKAVAHKALVQARAALVAAGAVPGRRTDRSAA